MRREPPVQPPSGGDIPPNPDERALIAAVVRRDPRAWAEIYERFADGLLGFFVHQLHDRAAAEDLTSEVFLEALRAADRFAPRGGQHGDLGDLLAWLFRIARNNLIDYYRRQRRSPTEPLELAEEADLARAVPSVDPGEAAIAALDQQRVLQAIAGLSPDQREVILLRLSGGLTSPQIAEIVGKTAGAVKALQHRALATLIRALNPEAAPGGVGPTRGEGS
ncbi:MAG: RNA polymerase sigma factor [Actinomycetota bacterium]